MRNGWLLAPVAAALLTGCDLPGKPDPADRPVPANRVTDFVTLYGTNCAGCHGADGRFGPAPPLNDALFLSIIPDEELQMVIAHGRPGTPMPGFATAHGGPLTDEQIRAVATGLKSTWSVAGPSAGQVPPYVAVDSARGDKGRGSALFDAACARCHGTQGRGGGLLGARGVINSPPFLALLSDQAVRRYVITGRLDLGMPDYAKVASKPLTAAQVDDLVAFVASWRRKD